MLCAQHAFWRIALPSDTGCLRWVGFHRYRGRVIERSEQGADPSVEPDPAPVRPPKTSPPPAVRGPGQWAPPPPGAPPSTLLLPGPSSTGPDIPLNRQLDAGAAPNGRPAAWMWLLFAALGFVGGQVVAAVFVAITAAVEGKSSSLAAISHLSEPPTWYVVSTLIGLWAGFFGAGWLATSVRGTKSFARDLGLRFKWIDLVGIPIGVGGQILIGLLYIPISHHVHDFNQRFNGPSQRLTGGSHGVGFAIIAICTIVGAPFFEELFFRGVLLRALARLFGDFGRWVGPALAIIITGVVFGLAHAESLQLLGLALFGIVLSFVSYRTGRLGMNMVAHASFNALAVAFAVVLPLLGLTGPPF
jgi:membrane protease YdiL (CAAX protease family)